MELTREQKKGKLTKETEKLIEMLLDWEEGNRRPNMTQIEEEVLKLREGFGQALVRVVLEGQEVRQPVTAPVCPGCGKAMRNKGEKKKGIESRLGMVEMERGYYYCSDCESGLFPPRPTT
jgi:hypothetical protein